MTNGRAPPTIRGMQSTTHMPRTSTVAATPLAGKVAIVTGASRGIGAVTARALADAGAAVAVAARDHEGLIAVAGAIEQTGGHALPVPTDVADPHEVRHLVRHTVDTYGRLDIAFNNAGESHTPTPLHELSIEEFDDSIATAVRGLFLCLREEIPAMLDTAGEGAIVNMASTAGIEPVAGLGGYVAGKHASIGLTKVAALEYAARGVRVNAVAPGPILTDRLQQAGPEAQRAAAAAMPMRRIGTPQEVADAVVWLCSDKAAFVTGVVLPIDGGKLAGTVPFQAVRS
jgi:NAD(P)-dependent dehydrogenase (short-subunit alcohol dehydrogenase family)